MKKPKPQSHDDDDQDDPVSNNPAMPRKRLHRGEGDDDDAKRKRNILATDIEKLLYSRTQAAQALSTSTVTITRLEQAGLLRPVKLSPSPKAMVYYRAEDIRKLAQVGVD
jgi:hypothetical protein